MGTATLSLRLDAADKQLITDYAHIQGRSISSVMRDAIIERIEDEYDIKIADAAYQEHQENPTVYSSDEVKTLLGL
jgi:uncharacterized protein (DUF1778 family)